MYPIPTLAKKFFSIFSFNPKGHGVTQILKNQFTPEGKQKSKSWWEHKETTDELWEAHLEGKKSIGQVPINYEGKVQWAAFDVDIYKNQLDIKGILSIIATMDWPFILVRSKSGGAHAYVFFTEPTPAKEIIEKIKDFTAFFGFANAEVFPKQCFLQTGNESVDFGNWLNMPYNGPESLRYALKKENEAYDSSEFCDLVEAKRIAPSEFLNLLVPSDENEPFPDGPPCLNRIFTENLNGEGHRDTSLFNLAVYLHRKDEDSFKTGKKKTVLHEWNEKFELPLDNKAVAAKIRTVTKKDYRYQCGNMCLKRFCKASVCKQRKYGIDAEDLDPTNQSLIQLQTDPELWYFTHRGVQVCVQRSELWNYDLLRQAFMAEGRIIPPSMKQEDWLLLLKSYLATCTVITVPPEATSTGQLINILEEWKKIASKSEEALCNGSPLLSETGELIFRMTDLKDLLTRKQFRALPDNKVVEVIQNKLKGKEKRVKAGTKTPRCWVIPEGQLEEAIELEINKPTQTENVI